MTGLRTGAVYICGGDYRPGPRDACPESLHDWPLPSGYVDAGEVAGSRLAHGWRNVRCPKCKLYGWVPGRPTPHNDTSVPYPRKDRTMSTPPLAPGVIPEPTATIVKNQLVELLEECIDSAKENDYPYNWGVVYGLRRAMYSIGLPTLAIPGWDGKD